MPTINVVLLSIPGLRERDLAAMPNLSRLAAGGDAPRSCPAFRPSPARCRPT